MREVWGVFLARAYWGLGYDLQALYETEAEAKAFAGELRRVSEREGISGWVELSTGRHWAEPGGDIIRVSPVPIGRPRNRPEDFDTNALVPEIEAVRRG